MGTHPARLTEIITGMAPAFAGVVRPREAQVAEAVELVLATNPTLEELADARTELLERDQVWAHDETPFERDRRLRDRAAKADALAIVEQRLRG